MVGNPHGAWTPTENASDVRHLEACDMTQQDHLCLLSGQLSDQRQCGLGREHLVDGSADVARPGHVAQDPVGVNGLRRPVGAALGVHESGTRDGEDPGLPAS
jgi:hypothetical protein